jgi:hypothetical protein
MGCMAGAGCAPFILSMTLGVFHPADNTSFREQERGHAPVRASAADDVEVIQSAVRSFIAASGHGMSPSTRIELDRYEIPGLEERLDASAYLAKFLTVEGGPFNELLFLYRRGAVVPFGETFGGWGLMSGVVHGRCFYYTYSWGSGIHRSHVGRLAVERGELKGGESAAFQNVDVFVSKTERGISIDSGEFIAFNRWRGSVFVEQAQSLLPGSQSCGPDL